MMEVQKFIRTHGLEKLTTELGIKVRPYEDHQIIVLNYSQIDSPKTHPVVIECRGLILDNETFEPLCRPFDRFFNYGEAPETYSEFQITRSVGFDKLDGSLIKIWYHSRTNTWYCGTRGTAFAEADVYGWPLTFDQLVYRAVGVNNHEEFNELCHMYLNKSISYMFEVTSRENRVVTVYENTNLWFLGGRYTNSGLPVSDCGSFPCLSPAQYSFSDAEQCKRVANSLTDLKEGFVLYDPVADKRVKVKSDTYVTLHHIKGEGLNPKRIMELVCANEQDEYLTHFPEDREHIQPIADAQVKMMREMANNYEKVREIEEQKEFALAVKHLTYSGMLFSARGQKKEPWQMWEALELNKRYKVLLSYVESEDK